MYGTVSIEDEKHLNLHAPSHGVAKRAGGVDDDTCIDRKRLTGQLVAAHRATHAAFDVL